MGRCHLHQSRRQPGKVRNCASHAHLLSLCCEDDDLARSGHQGQRSCFGRCEASRGRSQIRRGQRGIGPLGVHIGQTTFAGNDHALDRSQQSIRAALLDPHVGCARDCILPQWHCQVRGERGSGALVLSDVQSVESFYQIRENCLDRYRDIYAAPRHEDGPYYGHASSQSR